MGPREGPQWREEGEREEGREEERKGGKEERREGGRKGGRKGGRDGREGRRGVTCLLFKRGGSFHTRVVLEGSLLTTGGGWWLEG